MTKHDGSALDVAKLFVFWANCEGDLITHLKLQKLVYYAEAWHLVNFSGKSLYDDPIEAWALGPVVRPVWQKYRHYRGSAIPFDCSGDVDKKAEALLKPFTKPQRFYLTKFYEFFHKYSAHELVTLTHSGDPWKTTPRNSYIDRDVHA